VAQELHLWVRLPDEHPEGVVPMLRLFSDKTTSRETFTAPLIDAMIPRHLETATFAVG
jgi:hypothetical protein